MALIKMKADLSISDQVFLSPLSYVRVKRSGATAPFDLTFDVSVCKINIFTAPSGLYLSNVTSSNDVSTTKPIHHFSDFLYNTIKVLPTM